MCCVCVSIAHRGARRAQRSGEFATRRVKVKVISDLVFVKNSGFVKTSSIAFRECNCRVYFLVVRNSWSTMFQSASGVPSEMYRDSFYALTRDDT